MSFSLRLLSQPRNSSSFLVPPTPTIARQPASTPVPQGLPFRLKVALAAAYPVLAVERILFRAQAHPRPGAVRSVLILAYRVPLGCCVHLTPLYEAIRQSQPRTAITVACSGLGAKLLRHHPAIDHLIVTPDPSHGMARAISFLHKELMRRGTEPDCVLTGASDGQPRLAAVGLLSGAGWRGGYTLMPALYQAPLTYNSGASLIDNNLQVGRLVGASVEHREPAVYFSPKDLAAAITLVREASPDGRPLLIFVTQGSGDQNTGWHVDRFAQVIRHACEILGCAVAYVGTAKQSAAVEEIRSAAGGLGVSLTGRTGVTELAALLALSDGMVSVDTGTMHVGRAVSLPMVVIGPSWQKPIEWLPLGQDRAWILRGEDRSDIPPNYRLDEVQATQVINALNELVRAYPASEQSRAQRVQARLSTVDHTA